MVRYMVELLIMTAWIKRSNLTQPHAHGNAAISPGLHGLKKWTALIKVRAVLSSEVLRSNCAQCSLTDITGWYIFHQMIFVISSKSVAACEFTCHWKHVIQIKKNELCWCIRHLLRSTWHNLHDNSITALTYFCNFLGHFCSSGSNVGYSQALYLSHSQTTSVHDP